VCAHVCICPRVHTINSCTYIPRSYSDAITRSREIAIPFATRRTNNGKIGRSARVEATSALIRTRFVSRISFLGVSGRGNELTRTYAGVSRFEKRESVEARSAFALRSRSNSPDEKRSESFQLAVLPLAREKIRAVVLSCRTRRESRESRGG